MRLPLGFVGFGNVGQEFGRLLLEKKEILRDKYDLETEIVLICTKTRGVLASDQGIDLNEILARLSRGALLSSPDQTPRTDVLDLIRGTTADIVFELTPLDVFTGQPATLHIETAIRAGKHVITANKGPIANHYQDLRDLANSRNVCFRFEGTVMDGTPIFNLVSDCLPASEVLSFRGVLNSTTNFILTEMEKGVGFAAALSKAQRLGIAEADPYLDIDGWDSAAKVSAMMNVFMDADVNPQQVERRGIGGVTESKVSQLLQVGRRIKLVCESVKNQRHPRGRVAPMELPLTDPLANVSGTSSILEIETDTMGRLTILENEPRVRQTAYALLSDLISIRRRMH